MATLGRATHRAVPSLRQAVVIDGCASALVGLWSLAAAVLDVRLGLRPALTAGSGAVALTYGCALLRLARRPAIPLLAGRATAAGNVAWAAAWCALARSRGVAPPRAGRVLILAHVFGALAFAGLQALGVRAGASPVSARA